MTINKPDPPLDPEGTSGAGRKVLAARWCRQDRSYVFRVLQESRPASPDIPLLPSAIKYDRTNETRPDLGFQLMELIVHDR